MTVFTAKYTIKTLAEKKVPFAVKCNYQNMTVKLIGLDVRKEGKFWKVNGKIVGGNFIDNIMTLVTGVHVTQEQITQF